jgi:hypothetical protein
MATFTRHQVAVINQVSSYRSTCRGVFYTQPTNQWFAKFDAKDIKVHLGFFDTEKEAIQAYSDYHDKFYQEVLTQIKKKKDEE